MASIISFKHHGDLKKTDTFLRRLLKQDLSTILERYAQMGVDALSAATPVDTGKTAASWGYVITRTSDTATITWTNSNVNNGVPIALILQYGHGTGTGGYVKGRDYIKPAIRPVFDELANELWKEVTGR